MLIIWGSRKSFKPIGGIEAVCPNCGSQMGLFWAVKKFTLYWIPLFPMDKNYAMGCQRCKTFYALSQAAGAQMHSQIMMGTIGKVNASPPMSIPPPNAPLYPPTTGYQQAIPPPPPLPEAQTVPCVLCGRPLEAGTMICRHCGAKAR